MITKVFKINTFYWKQTSSVTECKLLNLLVGEFLAGVRLLRVVEPVDPDHHVAAPGLPHALDAADEGQVGPPGRQEHGAVPDADHLPATHDGLVEEFLGLALHSASLEKTEKCLQMKAAGFFLSGGGGSLSHLSGFPKPLPELPGWKKGRDFGPVLHAGEPLSFSQLLGRWEVHPLPPFGPLHLPLSSAGLRLGRTAPLPRDLPGGGFRRFSGNRSIGGWRG